MLRVLLLLFMISTSLSAKLNLDIPANIAITNNFKKKVKTKFGLTKYYDTNKDGKSDHLFIYKHSQLIEEKIDRNYDGEFDHYIKHHFDNEVKNGRQLVTVERFDNNFDKKIELIKQTYAVKKYNQLIIEYLEDRDKDGKFEHRYNQHIPMVQEKDFSDPAPCPAVNNTFTELYNLVDEFSSFLPTKNVPSKKHNFTGTDFGINFHISCIERFGKNNISKLVKDSLQQGLQCLANLVKKALPGKMSLAQINATKMQNLLAESPVKLICNEKDYDWSQAVAYASTGSSSDIIDKDNVFAAHPYISVWPEYNPLNKDKDYYSSERFKSTVFHELFHNIGHKHGETIESPYTCEVCCFPEGNASLELMKLACKICTGSYDSNTSHDYIDDFVNYAILDLNRDLAYPTLINLLKSEDSKVYAMSKMVQLKGDLFAPFSVSLAKILKEKNFEQLSPESKKILEDVLLAADDPSHVKYQNYSKIPATAFYIRHFDQARSSVSFFEENIDKMVQLKTNFINKEEQKKLTEIESLAIEDIIKNTEKILLDNWLDLYNNIQRSTKGKEDPREIESEKSAFDMYVKFRDIGKPIKYISS